MSLLTHVASAMSVAVPTFGELVTEAAAIVRAQVVSSSSHTSLSPDGKRLAYTSVTFTVLKTLKGDGEKTMTLTFLGGAADGVVTRVPGMPQFAVGETDFLFIGKNREAACPLIAGEFGRYKLRIDEEKARTDVPAATRYLKPAGESAAPTDEEFESAINSELTRSKS